MQKTVFKSGRAGRDFRSAKGEEVTHSLRKYEENLGSEGKEAKLENATKKATRALLLT